MYICSLFFRGTRAAVKPSRSVHSDAAIVESFHACV